MGRRMGTGTFKSTDELETEAKLFCESVASNALRDDVDVDADTPGLVVFDVLPATVAATGNALAISIMDIRLGSVARMSSRDPCKPSINFIWTIFWFSKKTA